MPNYPAIPALPLPDQWIQTFFKSGAVAAYRLIINLPKAWWANETRATWDDGLFLGLLGFGCGGTVNSRWAWV